MKFQLGAMSVGDILDRGLKLLFQRLGTFYGINLLVQSPLILYQVAVALAGISTGQRGIGLVILGSLAAIVVTMVVSAFGTAAVLKVVEQEYLGRKIGMGSALTFAFSRFLPLIAVALIYGLVIGVGFVLLIVPAFIFMCMYAFGSQAVVLEGVGPIKGMDRSQWLTKNYRLRVFGILLLIGIVNFVVTGGLAVALQFVLPNSAMVRDAAGQLVMQIIPMNYVIDTVVTTLVSILISTYLTVCLTLTYFDLRVRKEGYDLELATTAEIPAAELV